VVVLVLREVPEADLAVVPAQVQEHAAAETDAHHCERHQRAEHYRDRLALGRIGGVTFLRGPVDDLAVRRRRWLRFVRTHLRFVRRRPAGRGERGR